MCALLLKWFSVYCLGARGGPDLLLLTSSASMTRASPSKQLLPAKSLKPAEGVSEQLLPGQVDPQLNPNLPRFTSHLLSLPGALCWTLRAGRGGREQEVSGEVPTWAVPGDEPGGRDCRWLLHCDETAVMMMTALQHLLLCPVWRSHLWICSSAFPSFWQAAGGRGGSY